MTEVAKVAEVAECVECGSNEFHVFEGLDANCADCGEYRAFDAWEKRACGRCEIVTPLPACFTWWTCHGCETENGKR